MSALTESAPPTTTHPLRAEVGIADPPPIPFGRIVRMELRKSFDTRAGFWLLASIGIAAVLATVATIVWAPDDVLGFESFATAIGVPMAVLLPIVAILSVTSEWSQRTGLSTFTLVPRRSRTIAAKATGALLVGVVSMVVAMGIGALGTVLGASLRGVDVVWDTSTAGLARIVLAQVLGMAVGFMLGVLLRSSPGAIVGYFVFSFVLPTLAMALAAFQDWFKDLQPWVDFNYAQTKLFDDALSGTEWTQLGVTGLFWLVVPTALGLWALLRAEIR